MGITKTLYQEQLENGYSYSDDKNICSNCLKKHISGDPDLLQLFDSNKKDQKCGFCNRNTKVINIDLITERILSAIKLFYQSQESAGIPWPDDDYGWTSGIYSTEDVFSDLCIDKNAVSEFIINQINCDCWIKLEDYFISGSEFMINSWENFSKIVKYERRYTFLQSESYDNENMNPIAFLEKLFEDLVILDLFKNIDTTKNIYRVRIHKKEEIVKNAEEIGTIAPEKCHKSNRFSAAGIPLFYGSFEKESALEEVVNNEYEKTLDDITVGEFKLTDTAHLVDFTNLPKLPGIYSKDNHFRETIIFFESFIKEISKPIVRDGYENINYCPTQIIIEYIRFNKEWGTEIHGIIYPSSKNSKKKCCALFINNDHCYNKGDDIQKSEMGLILEKIYQETT